MLSDLNFIIFWYLSINSIALIFLPLTFSLFKKFWDKGYIFSKIIGVLIFSYLTFTLGVLKILPFTNTSFLIIFSLIILTNFIFFFFNKNCFKKFIQVLKEKYKFFVFEEILFLIILISWSFVRGFAPDLEGLEKYMDWGFINTILRSRFSPPQDMWFAGSPINYYYFGHYIFAFLTKFSTISSTITYNLSIATICAMAFTFSFSLVSNLVYLFLSCPVKGRVREGFSYQVVFFGLISAFLLTFGGNLHPLYKIIKINITDNNKLTKDAFIKSASKYWYPDATRFIGYDPITSDKTIHEFPIYSFVVSDLHGHLNDLPIVIFFLAFLLSISLIKSSEKILNFKLIIPSALILAIAYMTNAWDFAIYGIFFAIFTFLNNLKSNKLLISFNKTLSNGFLTIVFWYLFSLPFSLNFSPMTQGIKLADSHTPFYQLFILYGGFWLINIPIILVLIYRFFRRYLKLTKSDIFAFSLFVTATILIIIPEFVYIKDIYIYEHRRANTMFKLVYQAFILYSLSSGYFIFRAKTLISQKIIRIFYYLLAVVIFIIHLSYPYFAIKSFYGIENYQGLYGLNYLKDLYPDNFIAINWLNKNVSGQPVILEAVGDSYTTFGQVSVSTGLPTVQGWIVHEWLWRGGYDKPKERQDDVQKIYESQDTNETKTLLQKYNVKYIFVGNKEREKYPNLNEDIFIKIGGQVVFQSGKTKIYQL